MERFLVSALCQQILIEVGMDQKIPLSSVGSDASRATPSMAEGAALSVSPHPDDEAIVDEFEMEQASSLSRNLLQQILTYVPSL